MTAHSLALQTKSLHDNESEMPEDAFTTFIEGAASFVGWMIDNAEQQTVSEEILLKWIATWERAIRHGVPGLSGAWMSAAVDLPQEGNEDSWGNVAVILEPGKSPQLLPAEEVPEMAKRHPQLMWASTGIEYPQMCAK